MLKKFILIIFIFIINLFNWAAAEEVYKINSVHFDNSDNVIFLASPSKVQYINVKSMKLTNPDRLIFDVQDSVLTRSNSSWDFKNSDIKQVKVSQFTTNPNVVRIVITYNKDFKADKVKIHRVDNNLVISYNKNLFPQSDLRSIYDDEKSEVNYYEYTTFNEEEKPAQPAVNTSVQKPAEAIAVQKAFNSKGELVKPDASKILVDDTPVSKLKSAFYVNKIDIKRGNALIRGIGSIGIEKPFVVKNPDRLVFDLPNTYVAQDIRNKEFVLSEKETIKIGQFEPTKARIVVTTTEPDKFRPIYSYDSQSIFLAHDDRILGLTFYDKTSAIYTYSAKKLNDTTDTLLFTFTQPVVHSIKRLGSVLEVNLYNCSGFNHEAFKKNLNSEIFAKLRTEALKPYGIKMIIPIKDTTVIKYTQSFDNKQLSLQLSTPKDTEINKTGPLFIKRNPNVKTIVIDAGHGGSDVGATREGIYEKDITLDISKRLAKILDKKGYNVLMIRDKDQTVSLQDRVKYTEDNHGDLFVSIHVNSSLTTEGVGIETHYFTPQSYDFAQIVHKEFANTIKAKDRGLFKSRFYVIKNTTCPSILVETGFISNPEERKELMTSERRQKTAEAIAKGIQKYLGKE